MAVEVVYRSSRDPERLFMDKAEADRHDKMLELAENLSEALHKAVPSLSEEQLAFTWHVIAKFLPAPSKTNLKHSANWIKIAPNRVIDAGPDRAGEQNTARLIRSIRPESCLAIDQSNYASIPPCKQSLF